MSPVSDTAVGRGFVLNYSVVLREQMSAALPSPRQSSAVIIAGFSRVGVQNRAPDFPAGTKHSFYSGFRLPG